MKMAEGLIRRKANWGKEKSEMVLKWFATLAGFPSDLPI